VAVGDGGLSPITRRAPMEEVYHGEASLVVGLARVVVYRRGGESLSSRVSSF
jgi:hypothetical protein